MKTTLLYDVEGRQNFIRAVSDGWECAWASHDGFLVPDAWRRGPETKSAYHAGNRKDFWIDPTAQKIAEVLYEDSTKPEK
jgi:hypothetical protein